MLRLLPMLAVLMFGPLLGACGDRGPDVAAKAFVDRLGVYQSNPFPKNLKPVYEALDATSRATLAARAAELSTASSTTVEPWEALAYRGLTDGVRVAGYEVVEQGEGAATVEISFAAVVPKDMGGPAVQPPPVRLSMQMEDGEWRFVLPLGGG